jgi:hypothetical protein
MQKIKRQILFWTGLERTEKFKKISKILIHLLAEDAHAHTSLDIQYC